MNIKFTIHGPFEIRKAKNGLISSTTNDRKSFWDIVEKNELGLSHACGCYLFGVRAGLGGKPWYIGLTSRRSFLNECLGSHQRNIYNEVIAAQKGTPILFLIARRTKGGRFKRPSSRDQKSIIYLETLLIGAGLDRNKELRNIRKTKLLKTMIVPGFLNTPQQRPSKAQQEFESILH